MGRELLKWLAAPLPRGDLRQRLALLLATTKCRGGGAKRQNSPQV
jgi:hypothetical protein